MKCPKCKLINPDNALRCDCGYEFQTKHDQGKELVETTGHATGKEAETETTKQEDKKKAIKKPELPALPSDFEHLKYVSSGILPVRAAFMILGIGFGISLITVTIIFAVQTVTLSIIEQFKIENESLSTFIGIIFLIIYGIVGLIFSGYVISSGAKMGKSRNFKANAVLAFISSGIGFLVVYLVAAKIYYEYPQEVIVGGVLFAALVALSVYYSKEDVTYCENCDRWYSIKESVLLDPAAADTLIDVLTHADASDGSLHQFVLKKSSEQQQARISLDIHKCSQDVNSQCHYRILAQIRWQEHSYDATGQKHESHESEDYFDIFIPHARGQNLEQALSSP